MSTFIKNIGLVALGPILASVIGFLAEPWISRLWEPAVYGVGSHFNAVLQTFTPIMFLRYNFAIVQAKNEREEANLLALSLIVMFFLVALVIMGLPILDIASKGGIHIAGYKFLFFSALVTGSLSTLLRFWYSSKKKFLHLSLSMMLFSLSALLLLLIYGFIGKTSDHTMIMIRAVSYIFFPLVMLIDFLVSDYKPWVKLVSLKGIVSVARIYKDYPLHEYLGFVANIVAFNLPIILIARFWGNEITGLYSKAFIILYMFVTILGDSVNRVLHKEVADMVNSGRDISAFVKQITLSIVSLSIVPFTLIVVAGPEIFSIFLGQRWLMSGVFAQAMAIWSFANLLNLSILPLYGVLNKQKQYTRFTLITLVLRAGIISLMGTLQIDVVLTLYIFSLANFAILMGQSLYIMNASGVSYSWSFNRLAEKMLQISPLVVGLYLVRVLTAITPIAFILLCGIASLPYLYLYVVKSKMLKMITSSFLKKG